MMQVLLVEDNPNDALLMQRLLRSAAPERCALVHEASMERATTHLSREPVDVVLLDLGLPDANGLDAVSQILEAAPHIPVVVLTTSREDTDVAAAYALGVNSYIVKPVEFEKFIEVAAQIDLYWCVLNQQAI